MDESRRKELKKIYEDKNLMWEIIGAPTSLLSKDQLVCCLINAYEESSMEELIGLRLSQDGYEEAVEALEYLGCQKPSEEEMQKYMALGSTNEERNKRRYEEQRRLAKEKYWILRRNAPNLSAQLEEAHRIREEDSRAYGRIKDKLWEKHKDYKRATDPYWCSGASDYQFQEVLSENPDARHADNLHRTSWNKSQDLEGLFQSWAEKITLEEAKSTNLDEKLNAK